MNGDRPHRGRVALITGGSRGIGQSVAVELARRGAHVVIGARTDQSETAQLVGDAGGAALALTLDISDPAVSTTPAPASKPTSDRSTSWSTTRRRSKRRPGTRWTSSSGSA